MRLPGFALALLCAGCSRSGGGPAIFPAPPGFISTDRSFLRDDQGRVRIFRGVNARVAGVFDVTFLDGRLPVEPIPPFGASDAARMREIGFDVLRLPVSWSALEPAPGWFDPAYLDRVAAVVGTAEGAGIAVLLDLHQDAFSKEIGEDGAPLWAIVPPPTQLLGGPLVDLGARRSSGQTLAAFQTFFAASTSGAGVFLRRAFGVAASRLAARFAADPGVLGYEVFNEPFLTQPDTLRSFEEETAAAIRQTDPYHLLFFEPDVLRDATDSAPVPATPFADPRGVYAPHVYTLTFTSSAPDRYLTASWDELLPSLAGAGREAKGWGAPLWIGEWGADPHAPGAGGYLELEAELQDYELASSTYWVWKEESQGFWGLFDHDPATDRWTERESMFRALARPHARAIPGTPGEVSFDKSTGRFRVAWQGGSGPLEVAIPVAPLYPAFRAVCDGGPVVPTPLGVARYSIACPGDGPHEVVIAPVP